MTTEVLPYAEKRLTPAQAIFFGGLTVGVLDILSAILFWYFRTGAKPIVIFQSVASGLLGREAARAGGIPTAVLGGALHFFIATTIVAIYVLASRRLDLLARRPVLCGLLYGVVAYFVMSYVVVPLSAANFTGGIPPWPVFLFGIIGHALFVGLPGALFAARAHS